MDLSSIPFSSWLTDGLPPRPESKPENNPDKTIRCGRNAGLLIRWRPPGNDTVCRALIIEKGEALKGLCCYIDSWAMANPYNLPDQSKGMELNSQPHLHCNTNLEVLGLGIIHKVCPWLVPFLNTVSSPHLRIIIIEVETQEVLECMIQTPQIQHLANALSNARFNNLRILQFRVQRGQRGPTYQGTIDRIKQVLSSGRPRLDIDCRTPS